MFGLDNSCIEEASMLMVGKKKKQTKKEALPLVQCGQTCTVPFLLLIYKALVIK